MVKNGERFATAEALKLHARWSSTWTRNAAGIGWLHLPGENLHKGRLAGAIRPSETVAVARRKLHRYIIEKHPGVMSL